MLRHTSYYEVRLPYIRRNIEKIRADYAPQSTLIAMVKGDAYGHGLLPVAEYMHRQCSIRNFGVASLGEGLALVKGAARGNYVYEADLNSGESRSRDAILHVNEKDTTVVVFSDTEILNDKLRQHYQVHNNSQADGARLIPVVGSLPALEMYCKHKRDELKDTPLYLKLNTGMNRLGLMQEELDEAATMIKEYCGGVVDVALQHSSVTGLAGHSFTKQQHDNFRTMTAYLQDHKVSIGGTSVANSGAIEQRLGVEETYVRPGLMCYGPSSLAPKTNPNPENPWSGECPGHLYTKVLARYAVTAGSYVGYGINSNLVSKDGILVLLPIGYADGFLRYYRNMPICVTPAADRRSPHSPSSSDGSKPTSITGRVFGNINMDMTSVVVFPEDVDDGAHSIDDLLSMIKEESEVLVWGQDVLSQAEAVKTVPYQLMCGLSTRIPRVYVE